MIKLDTLLELITIAVTENRQMVIDYERKEVKTSRLVEPHVVYPHATTGNWLLDAYQWSGDSESKRQWQWKPFRLDRIAGASLGDIIKRSSAIGYKPESDRYAKAIIKKVG